MSFATSPALADPVTSAYELGDSLQPEIPGTGELQPAAELPGPDWAELFNSDGSLRDTVGADGSAGANGIPDYVDLYHGKAALFLGDEVSLGTTKDYSVRKGDRLDRGLVASASDELGNAYLYLTADSSGGLVVYLGLERLQAGASTVEFEFNQNLLRLGHGWPGKTGWEIDGTRRANDLKVTLAFGPDGRLTSLAADGWTGTEWTRRAAIAAEGCSEGATLCAFRNASSVPGGSWTSYDAAGQATTTLAADHFLEVGVHAGALLGIADPAYGFATVQVRTPSDMALGHLGGN